MGNNCCYCDPTCVDYGDCCDDRETYLCDDLCGPDCMWIWLEDDICDEECLTEDCLWDFADCYTEDTCSYECIDPNYAYS